MVKLNEAKSVVVLSLGKEILACDSGDKHGPQAQTQQCAAGYFYVGSVARSTLSRRQLQNT